MMQFVVNIWIFSCEQTVKQTEQGDVAAKTHLYLVTIYTVVY